MLAGQSGFALDYPCHSPDLERWFQLQVSRLEDAGAVYAIVAHHGITGRILAEQERQAILAKAQRRQDQLEALTEAFVRIAAVLSPEATLQEITDQARLVVGAHLAATHSISDNLWDHAAVAVSLSETYAQFASFAVAPTGAGVDAHVARSGRPLRLTKAALHEHPCWGNYGKPPPLQGLLAVPPDAAAW